MSKTKEYWVNQSKSFDSSADYYDKFRPSYPKELVADIIEKTGVNNNSNILEIGAGSGKATELFVNKGLNITCIEPGVKLAEKGMEKFKHTHQVEYIVNRFEEWNEVLDYYDLIFSAQAFHWVPKPLGYEKSFNLLKANKYFGLFWNFYLSSGERVEVDLRELFKEYPLGYIDTKEELENRIQNTIDEIRNSNCFKNIEVIRYPWSQVCNADEYIGFLKTGNGYLTLSEDKRKVVENRLKEIIQKYGDTITRNYECVLFLAQKK